MSRSKLAATLCTLITPSFRTVGDDAPVAPRG